MKLFPALKYEGKLKDTVRTIGGILFVALLFSVVVFGPTILDNLHTGRYHLFKSLNQILTSFPPIVRIIVYSCLALLLLATAILSFGGIILGHLFANTNLSGAGVYRRLRELFKKKDH